MPFDSPASHAELPYLSFHGSSYSADESSDFIIDGQRLTSGDIITANGTPISLPSAKEDIVIGTGIYPLILVTNTGPALPVFTLGGSTYTAEGSPKLVTASQAISYAGATTSHATVPSSQATGENEPVIVATQPLSSYSALPVISFKGEAITQDPSPDYVINGQTLRPGPAITADGTVISLPEAGSEMIIGSFTQNLELPSSTDNSSPEFTFAGSTSFANSTSAFVIEGHSLTRSGVITIHQTPISYASNGGMSLLLRAPRR